MTQPRNHPLLAALAAAAALALSACGGASTIERDKLEDAVQTQLSKTVGQEAPPASCPDELKAEKDAETRCSMDFGDQGTLGITVTVTSVDGDDAKFDIQADNELQDKPS